MLGQARTHNAKVTGMKSSALAMVLMVTGGAVDQADTDQRMRFEQGQARQREYERNQLMKQGLSPLNVESMEVRQLALSDPYGMLPTPALHFEHASTGKTVLRIMRPGQPSVTASVEPQAWRALQSKEAGVFVERAYKPWKDFGPDNPAPPPPPICHGWGAIVGSGGPSGPRTAIWGACGSTGPSPKLDYILEMMAIALRTQPDCLTEGDLFWAMNDCFVETHNRDEAG